MEKAESDVSDYVTVKIVKLLALPFRYQVLYAGLEMPIQC